ncbi:MAG: sarcosine oxidase subunit gamma family protein [Hyphomicrobiaceae bacterium]
MRDRGLFWSPVPDWASARIERAGLVVRPASAPAALHLASGDLAAIATAFRLEGTLGPRDPIPDGDYALRLAPDRCLVVSGAATAGAAGAAAGLHLSEVTDGYLLIDVTGKAARDLLAQGTSYDFSDATVRPAESANLLIGRLRVAVARTGEGFRLHVERPTATALWTWLDEVSALGVGAERHSSRA